MIVVKGRVYLTDGFDRLDLPGRECEFTIGSDWVIQGTRCSWVWPHEYVTNVAGGEIEIDAWNGVQVGVIDVGDLEGPPEIVRPGQPVTFTPCIRFEFTEKTMSIPSTEAL